MDMMRVRSRNTYSIALGPCGRVPLSPLDAYWVALPPMCSVFLFRSGLPFTAVLTAVRSSLERVLPAFHPFAGVLTYSPTSHALSISMEASDGVAFIEAEADAELDRLVEEHDQDALRPLAPNIRRDELPAPVMAVQVTELVGGVAVGLATHHSAADGRGLMRFLAMWSAAAGANEWAGPEPLHDRSLVRFHGDHNLACLYLQQLAPDIPRFPAAKHDADPLRLSRRTFMFAASAVQRLKRCLAAQTGTSPSTFAMMMVHGWVCAARARDLLDHNPVFAVFLADCRAYMSPPVPDAYIGNCVALCTASLRGSDLAGPDAPAMALLAIQKAIAEVRCDPLVHRARWCTMFAAIPPGRAVIFAGSPGYRAYQVDFGFGRPSRVEMVFMNHDGEIVLVAGRDPGSVQASVAIAADKMPAFSARFELDGCDCATTTSSSYLPNKL